MNPTHRTVVWGQALGDDAAPGWAVACTQPNAHRTVGGHLSRQGFNHYTPQYVERQVRQGRVHEVARPLFPGYTFVEMLAERWRSLRGTRGIRHILMEGDRPALMRASEVARLREREGEDGLVRLPKQGFQVGQGVRVGAGAFEGWDAIYDGQSAQDRCFVLLSLMGRRVRTQVHEGALAAA